MTREQKTAYLIAQDLYWIQTAMAAGDIEFAYSVLAGEGWVPYNQLTDEQLDETFEEFLEGQDPDTALDNKTGGALSRYMTTHPREYVKQILSGGFSVTY